MDVVPLYLRESTGVPAPVAGKDADAILTRLTRLCADLGLELPRSGDRAPYEAKTTATPEPAASL